MISVDSYCIDLGSLFKSYLKVQHPILLLKFHPQENKNLVIRVPEAARTPDFRKAYTEIEEYILTNKIPSAQDKPGEVLNKMNESYPRKKKNNGQVLIIKSP